MSDKPSYLGLLNAIAIGEAAAERYLTAWIGATSDDAVRSTLTQVCVREGEHAKSFAKRMCELGYGVIERADAAAEAERMKVASSTSLTDREKFEHFGLGRPVDRGTPDIFTGMFADQTIDIQTGTLLGRYIAEERDSGRLLRECYAAVSADSSNGTAVADAPTGRIDVLEACMTDVDNRLANIEIALHKLTKQSRKK